MLFSLLKSDKYFNSDSIKKDEERNLKRIQRKKETKKEKKQQQQQKQDLNFKFALRFSVFTLWYRHYAVVSSPMPPPIPFRRRHILTIVHRTLGGSTQ